MFRDCAFLTSFKFLSSWNTGKVTDMSEMFRNCSKLPEDLLTSINDWDISSVDIPAEPTTDTYGFYWICYNCQSHPNWPGTWTDDGTYIPEEEPMMLIAIATPSTPSNALCPEIATSSTPNKSTATEPSFIASPSEADRATSSVATRIIRHNNDKDEEDDDMSTPSSARRKNASGQNNKKKITVSIKKEDIKVEEKMFSGLTKRKLNKKINVSVEKITNRKVSEKIATSSIVRRKT